MVRGKIGMKGYILAACICFAFLTYGCVSTAGTGDSSGGAKAATGTSGSNGNDPIAEKMMQYLENGKAKIDYGSISEGIKQLVSVLAEKSKASSPNAEINEIAKEAEVQLTKLKAAISMEAEPSQWIDKSLNQVSGSTIDLSPQPSILLTIDTGIGRSIIANAPVAFRFTKGSGVCSGMVNTNDYGQADCKIVRFDNPKEENVIRASLVFKEQDFTYELEGLYRDFIYTPPARNATIMVLEKSELGASSDPGIADAVYNSLKGIDFQFAVYNGSFKPEEFEKVFGGDKLAISRLGLEEGVSYIIAVLSECYSVNQLELNGKKYQMFVSEARATTRVIRVADGKVLYDAKIERSKAQSKHGQGSSAEKAIRNVLSLSTEDMTSRLEKDYAQIDKALTGK
jgi:hypothetical protein